MLNHRSGHVSIRKDLKEGEDGLLHIVNCMYFFGLIGHCISTAANTQAYAGTKTESAVVSAARPATPTRHPRLEAHGHRLDINGNGRSAAAIPVPSPAPFACIIISDVLSSTFAFEFLRSISVRFLGS